MNKVTELINKILPAVSLGLFAIWTLSIIFFSVVAPGEAEAHAWTIAGNINPIQLIDLMKVEGHFLIWYLCLMPFAKFPQLYPWVMDIINWGFCLCALIVLWEKAPFNNLIKVMITFSVPFLKIYAIYPRCYSIGILFLFLAASLYKNRLEKPYKYILCLVAAANTSFIALIGAGILGILFVWDLVSQKSKVTKGFMIFLISAVILNLVLFYFQFHGVSMPDYEVEKTSIVPDYLMAFFGQVKALFPIEFLKIVLLWIAIPLFLIMFWKEKRTFIFFVSTELITLLFFTFVYGARNYHTCFMFIFAIIAFWMYKSVFDFEKLNFRDVVFGLLAFGMIFLNIHHSPAPLEFVTEPIFEDENLISGKLYSNFPPINLSVILPEIAKKGQTIYDMNGRDLNSYEALKIYFNKETKTMSPDNFAQHLEPNKRNFIILNGWFKDNYIQGKKYRFNVEPYKAFGESDEQLVNIYEIKNVMKF